MKSRTYARRNPLLPRLVLGLCGLVSLTGSGCILTDTLAFLPPFGMQLQTTMGGQTLPSAYYLRDDIQYFPAGPEDQLVNQRRALEEYRLEQEAIEAGLAAPAPGIP